MTQTVTHGDPAVAALQESVRHNEKNIDKLDRDLKDFRSEALRRFDKVDERIAQLETKTDQRFDKINDRFNQVTMLLVAIVGLVVALLVKLVIFT